MFLIAEAGVNHEGSIDRAIDQVGSVAAAGWQAIKFQTYKSSNIAAKNSPSYWDLKEEPTTNQRDLFLKHENYNIDWYKPVIDECKRLNIEFMTSVFSPDLVDVFDPFISRYKISSSDITNHLLLSKVAKKKKPIIMSTGASTLDEIAKAVSFLNDSGIKNSMITLLHCVLNYPTSKENANIRRILRLQESFTCDIGYSCHVKGIDGIKACEIAYLFGAKTIEKHITLTPFKSGNDHYHALDFDMMKNLSLTLKNSECIAGKGDDNIASQSSARLNARRGLYFSKSLGKGHVISYDDIKALRPTHDGLSADMADSILGKSLVNDANLEDPVHLSHFS